VTAYQDKDAIVQEWVVPAEYKGLRADEYLSMKIGRLSRSRAKRIILAGDFRRSDGMIKPSQILRGGETLHLWRMPPEEEELKFGSVSVIHEDDNWLVVNKPPDLAIHPTARYLRNTLTGWLKHYAPGVPVHPCHRIDRETSGVLVCAKNRKAEAALKTAFQRGEVRKTYMAIVRGHMKERVDIDVPLALQGDDGLVRIRMRADSEGLPSRTIVEPVRYDPQNDRSLVKCEPRTGRQHQIRAHLAHVGYPIVGDKLYAMGDVFFDNFTKRKDRDEILELEHFRHALHAHEIAFEFEGETLLFTAPFPNDFMGLMLL
jgi:23S rRNA pseudouridine1911/1915/1917 synthase